MFLVIRNISISADSTDVLDSNKKERWDKTYKYT